MHVYEIQVFDCAPKYDGGNFNRVENISVCLRVCASQGQVGFKVGKTGLGASAHGGICAYSAAISTLLCHSYAPLILRHTLTPKRIRGCCASASPSRPSGVAC